MSLHLREDIIRYFKKVATPFNLIAIMIALLWCHGGMLFSDSFGIDTELSILDINRNFDMTGRQGLGFFNKLLRMSGSHYNLYLAEGYTVLLFFLSVLSLGFLLYKLDEDSVSSRYGFFFLGVFFIVSPYWTAQLYFLNQSVPVLFALCLIPAALYCNILAYENLSKKWPISAFSVALMYLAFSAYQIQVVIYVIYTVAAYLVLFRNKKSKAADSFRWIGYQIIIFGIGVGAYFLITKLFFSSYEGYLSGQIHWGENNPAVQLKNIRDVIRFYSKGYIIYNSYKYFFGIWMLLSLCNMIREKKKLQQIILLVIAEFALGFIPYSLFFLFGGDVVPRMKYCFPIAQGLILYFLVHEIFLFAHMRKIGADKIKTGFFGITVCGLLFLVYRDFINNLDYSLRMYYTEKWRFECDTEIARNVYQDLKQYLEKEELDFEETLGKSVFLGTTAIPVKKMSVTFAMPGTSVWGEWDSDNFPRYRIYLFMEVMGFSLGGEPYYSDEEKEAFQYHFKDYFEKSVDSMPVYPNEGYIQFLKSDEGDQEYLVIKLGDDWKSRIGQ